MLWMVVAGTVYFLLARQILGVFPDDATVIDHGDGALMALALTLPAWACQSVYGGALRALGDARSPMRTNIAAMWLGVGIAWLGIRVFDVGLTFAWTAMLVASPFMVLTAQIFRRRLHQAEFAAGTETSVAGKG